MKKKTILTLSLFLLLVLVFFTFEYWYKAQPIEPVPLQKVEEQKPGNSFLQIENITLDQKIENPVLIEGKARGVWFFEASFPIEIQDEKGNILGRGIAQASSDWMTENFVPFTARIEFQKGDTKTGKIIFKKDNPSGDPARDDSFVLPVSF
jgi:hypothetical protein